MKLRFLTCALFLAAALTACNKEDRKGATPSEVETYMTLELIGQEGMTKTEGGENEAGSSEENKITTATILLCDAAEHKVQFLHEIPTGLVPVTGGVQTPVFPAITGSYEVYVIANKPSGYTISIGDVITSELLSSISETTMQNTYAKANTFMMFNASNASDDICGVPITITEDNIAERPATCDPIYLDRLAVKIRSKIDENGIDITAINGADNDDASFPAVTSVNLEGFKLVNGATKANLQQKWLKEANVQGTHPWSNTLITPVLNAGNSTGVAGEYYNHLSDFRTISKEASTGNYTAAKDMYHTIKNYGNTSTSPIYCMENNPTYINSAITTALNGNTTGLIYQWKATVNGSDNIAGTNSFYGYNGEFYATLESLFSNYPGLLGNTSNTDETFVEACTAAENELAAAYALKSSSDQAAMEEAISSFRTKYNVKVYTEGIMYYTYYIKDQNYKQLPAGTDANTEEPYYSVMRNTIYDLTVTALNGIGTDIPGGWNPDSDPEDPVDPTEVYMTVKVLVNNWVISSDDIILE